MLVFLLALLSACETVPEEEGEEYPDWFYNPFGYASLAVSKRNGVEAVRVADEIQFLDALSNPETQAIEIVSDLHLGSLELAAKLEAAGKELGDYRSVYRESAPPLAHPILQETGVGRVRIRDREGLVIYSKTGCAIKHAGFQIDGAKDVVIRNLRLAELWEWDDLGQGSYKRNDWDYFTIEHSEGIWLDHLTFEQAYDGIIDVKEGCSKLTLSFSKLDFRPNGFIETQIDHLEENREEFPYYDSLRKNGILKEEIIRMASCQKKGFNLGNTTDGMGFESITFTFHHLEVYNLQDRMPRIRKGDAHLYHVMVDNGYIRELNLLLNKKGVSLTNQGIVTTEDGAVLMENSIFIEVAAPVKTHQDGNSNPKYTGKFKVLRSAYIKNGKEHYGSSEGAVPVWTPANAHPLLPFAFRNHERPPYEYKLLDIAFLRDFFEKHPPGAQNLQDFDFLKIDNKLHERGE